MRCLRGITPTQIAKGLESCLTNNPIWPPGAAEFRSHCLDLKEDQDTWEQKGAAYVEYKRPALPDLNKQERNRKAGRAALDKLLNKDDKNVERA